MVDDVRDGYPGDIVLAWDNEPPAGAEEKVIADIRRSLWGLAEPGDLAFHSVFLTRDLSGPSVFVYGKAGSDRFHCEFCPTTEWS